jgi:hypothetical protein
MKKTTRAKKVAGKKVTRRAGKPRKTSTKETKWLVADLKTVGEMARKVKERCVAPATMQEAKIVGLNYEAITTAVAKALKKRDDAIMAELAKMQGLVRRVEEIVAVVERSEILLTKIDAIANLYKDPLLCIKDDEDGKRSVSFVPFQPVTEEEIQRQIRMGEMCASPQNGVPACAISAIAEVRVRYLPGARIEAATDRQGRMGRFYPCYGTEISYPAPSYVDFHQDDEKIRRDILALGLRFSRADLFEGDEDRLAAFRDLRKGIVREVEPKA